MAYMNQERKAIIQSNLKPVLARYGVKGSLSVRNHSTIVLTVKSGKIDFIENFIKTDKEKPYAKYMSDQQVETIRKNRHLDVNPHWFQEHFSGTAKSFLVDAMKALKSAGWYDESDAMTDYFNIAYYVDINIGKWNAPYALVK